MVDLGARTREPEHAPANLGRVDEQVWDIQFFGNFSSTSMTLIAIVPRSENLQSQAQVAEFASNNPARVSFIWLEKEQGRNVPLTDNERQAAIAALADTQVTFYGELGRIENRAALEEFGRRLDDAIARNPFNPERALYEIIRDGFFSEAESQADDGLKQAFRDVLVQKIQGMGIGSDYSTLAEQAQTLSAFLETFNGRLQDGLYQRACRYAFEQILTSGETALGGMYLMALEDFAGIPASAVQKWKSEGKLMDAYDPDKFWSMLISEVGTESLLSQYSPEQFDPDPRNRGLIELATSEFLSPMQEYITNISLSDNAKKDLMAEMYSNWSTTANISLRNAMAIDFFRVTGQDIGSEEMANIFREHWPPRSLQASRE